MNVTLISPTVLNVVWSTERTQPVIETWGLRVIYKAADNITRSILVNKHQSDVNISRLQPGTRYTIWAVRVTSKGFGFPSQALNITTPHQGNVYKIQNTKYCRGCKRMVNKIPFVVRKIFFYFCFSKCIFRWRFKMALSMCRLYYKLLDYVLKYPNM